MKLLGVNSCVDARTLGAKCNECPLRGYTTVLPQVNHDATMIVCGEAPGKEEIIQGRPFVGASGWFLDRQLVALGSSRSAMHVTNALLCRPPKKFSDLQWKQALLCCRPRLDAELALVKATSIAAFGGKAVFTLTDPTGPFNKPCSRDKIFSWRGAPLQSGRFAVMPSLHPAFVLRAPHYKEVFKIDLKRALCPSKPWVWPRIVVTPGAEMISALEEILQSNQPIGVDIENMGDPVAHARIRCIGVAIDTLAVSVPTELLPTEEMGILSKILASSNVKVMHNGQHDLLGLRDWGWVVNGALFDTLLAHVVVSSLLPHDLGFVASIFFDAPRWKALFKVEAEDRGLVMFVTKPIEDLCKYNACDAWMQRMLKDQLEPYLG